MQFKQYPSYKNSGVEWLGDVPEHWSVIPSKFYFIERKEKAENTDKQLTASQKHGIIFQEDFMAENGRVMVVMKNPEILKKVRPNDFVISMRSFQGGLELSYLEGSISSAYVMLKPNLNVVDIEYFKYLFKTPRYIQSLQSTSNLIRDGQALRFNNFSQIKLVLPPKADQEKIVSFLDTETSRIDNLIAKQEKLIELLEEQRKSIISHAVTKGLNPNAPMKDSGVEWLGEVPESWVEQKIKFISKLINEKTSEKSNVIALENIESWTGKYIETESSFESDAVKFKKNDVLFGKLRPYLAKVYLVENQGEAVGDIYVLRPNKLIHPQFLKFFMLSEKFIDYVNSSTNGTKMPRANWDFIGCISIFLPHIKVQHEIVEYLESAVLKIELIINKQISLIEKLKEYRASIISHAVTGKIDVREFGA